MYCWRCDLSFSLASILNFYKTRLRQSNESAVIYISGNWAFETSLFILNMLRIRIFCSFYVKYYYVSLYSKIISSNYLEGYCLIFHNLFSSHVKLVSSMLYLNMGEPIVYKPPGFFMGFLAIFSFIIFKYLMSIHVLWLNESIN